MNTLLLPLVGDDPGQSALSTAHLIAKRYASYIEGLFIRSAPPMVPRAPVPAHFLSQYRDYWDENADKAREHFATFMNDHDVAFREIVADSVGPTAWWREIEGEPDDVVGEYGRLFDLIVMARGAPTSSGEWSSFTTVP